MAYRQADEIVRDILSQLRWDERIESDRIRVEAEGDTVRLRGTVETLAALRAVEQIARGTPGVRQVISQIDVVYPGDRLPRDNSGLEHEILRAMKLHQSLSNERISVKADDGMITLRGSVDIYWKKLQATEVVTGIDETLVVVNEIAVTPGGDANDRQIAELIEGALEGVAGLDPEAVTVTVDRGMVVLAGKVPDWNALTSAEYVVAHTAGVVDVRNELIIAG